MEENKLRTIPRPLVRLNQWFIVISVVISLITGANWILALPLAAGLMGLLFRFNPVMKAGRLFLRKPLKDYIPEDWDQQQFNQLIAVICLAGALICNLLGFETAATVFSVMVALAAFIAILGFCIGCFIRFQYQQYRYRRSQSKA